VFFPDLPGCTSSGTNLQEAALNAEETLQGHTEVAVEHGEALPEPSGPGSIAAKPGTDEAARILVRAVL